MYGVPKDGTRTRRSARKKSRVCVDTASPAWHATRNTSPEAPTPSSFHQILIETGRGGNVHMTSIVWQESVHDESPHPGHYRMAVSGESKGLPRGLKPSRASGAEEGGGGIFGTLWLQRTRCHEAKTLEAQEWRNKWFQEQGTGGEGVRGEWHGREPSARRDPRAQSSQGTSPHELRAHPSLRSWE